MTCDDFLTPTGEDGSGFLRGGMLRGGTVDE